ncbi:putative baseplate assembly protein [Sulfidibacter corallicola]|uniref:Baseplate J/gp47 family protein n=1 Tax=Sulfidibacter corallicola TaxID=2818388 RepID=A0A8A4TIC5_SULCO|nr:baseplate J/gp47 family protein [Sulfidibacter corallicola]QTD49676.1 baseplate J/gp47 family protein [Sulfidibacter corallicola]
MTKARLDYSRRDYESIRRDLIAKIPLLTDQWTDHNPSDLGMVLLELFAAVGDLLAHHQDTIAAETYLATAQERQNLINLCALIGYRLDRPVPAATVIQFEVDAPLTEDLAIPRGTACVAAVPDENGTIEEIPFVTSENATLVTGERVVQVAAVQGRLFEESFAATGAAWQQFELHAHDLAQGHFHLWVDDDPWSEVAHFQDAIHSSRQFVLTTDGDDLTRVRFGDGIRGAIPQAGQTVKVTYLRTLGTRGNLGPRLINRTTETFYAGGLPIRLRVTNLIPATGGANRESIDHARLQAPAELEALWRGVTKDNYQALVEGFPGVAKAQVIDVNDCASVRYFQVNLAVAPNGGGHPSPQLLRDLQGFLDDRKVITQEIRLFDPDYVPIDVHVRCTLTSETSQAESRPNLEHVLADHFDFDRVGFGQTISPLDLRANLERVAGVVSAVVIQPAADHQLGLGQIPTLGTVQIDLVGGRT